MTFVSVIKDKKLKVCKVIEKSPFIPSAFSCSPWYACEFAVSEPHCKGTCMLFYENINIATITQMHCPIFICVEVFVLKINNRSQYTSQSLVILWATPEFAVKLSFLTHLVCICCGGDEVGGILLPGAGTLKAILFFLRKGELWNLPKGNHVICTGKGVVFFKSGITALINREKTTGTDKKKFVTDRKRFTAGFQYWNVLYRLKSINYKIQYI